MNRVRRRPSSSALVLAASLLACAKARPIADDTRGCPTWQAGQVGGKAGDLSNGTAPEISSVFAANCVSCHSAANPGGAAGGYDLSSYLGVLGLSVPLDPNVAPSSVAVAGNPNSRLVQILETPTDSIHAQFSSLAPVVAQWVGQCNLSFFNSAIHSSGILNPADPGFHGKLLQANGWNYGLCASCHGADFSGGAAGVACTACHTSPGGPTSCNTCHGLPPAEGAHFTHVDGGLGLDKPWSCTQCHVMPTGTDAGFLILDDAGIPLDDTGMLFAADGGLNTGPPSVVFGPLAQTSGYWTPGYDPASPPTFDPTTQTCSNVYCHGDTLGDTKASNTKPHWNEPGTGQAACGTCHGLPPSNHGSDFTQCSTCHGLVVDADQNFVDPARHVDGVLWLGNGDGTCSACHGSAASPAPPTDLEGNTATTFIGVGAHQSHLQALNHLRGPVACGDCHLVPQNPGSPGHIDHNLPATVFPAAIASTSLAFVDDAGPSENHANATCSNVYCHGGGEQMKTDKSMSLHRQPVWTEVNQGQAACGTCHAIPPQDGNPGHGVGSGLDTCCACHAGTVTPFGNIIITVLPDGGETSLHIDGLIEVDGGVWSGG